MVLKKIPLTIFFLLVVSVSLSYAQTQNLTEHLRSLIFEFHVNQQVASGAYLDSLITNEIDSLSEEQLAMAKYLNYVSHRSRGERVSYDFQEVYALLNYVQDDLVRGLIISEEAANKFTRFEWVGLMDLYQKAFAFLDGNLPEGHIEFGKLYGNMGNLMAATSNYGEALYYHAKSKEIFQKLYGEAHRFIMMYYNNVAIIYNRMGDFDRALRNYEIASDMALLVFPDNHPAQTQAMLNYATFFLTTGSPEKGITLVDSVRKMRQSFLPENHPAMERVYYRLSDGYRQIGEFEKAEEYLRKSIAINQGNPALMQQLLQNYLSLGRMFVENGRFEEGEYYLKEALKISEGSAAGTLLYNAAILQWIARSKYDQKKYKEALEYGFLSLAATHIDFDGTVGEFPSLDGFFNNIVAIDTYRIIGQSYKALGLNNNEVAYLHDAAKAFQYGHEFMWMVRMSQSSEASSVLLSQFTKRMNGLAINLYYELYQATNNPKWINEAFQILQQNKAATLQRSMSFVQNPALFGVTDEMRNREQQIRTELAQAEVRLRQARFANAPDQEVKQLVELVAAKNLEFDAYVDYVRANYPEYLEHRFRPILYSLEDLQAFLTNNEVYLEFGSYEVLSAIFTLAVSKDQVLFRRSNIDQSLDSNVHEFRSLLTSRSVVRGSQRERFVEMSHSLYRLLLEPVSEVMNGKNHVIIIPDDALHLMPFEALITSQDPGLRIQDQPFIIRDHSFRYHYNSSLFLQKERQRLAMNQQLQLKAMAPVFDFMPTFSTSTSSDNLRTTASALPYSKIEVNNVGRMFQDRGHKAALQIGTEAQKPDVQSLTGFDILHFATHGIFDADQPSFSGLLFADASKTGAEMLYANEIYTMNIPASLVVLSGCDSGFGNVRTGEGVISLNRAFMYAGARQLLYSLWQIGDQQTERFMTIFYTHLLDGKTEYEALQLAKLAMLEQSVSSLPLYWSAFLLMGS